MQVWATVVTTILAPRMATLRMADALRVLGPLALHGAPRVAEYWQRFYEGPQAPFSWEPDQVEVWPPARWPSAPGLYTTLRAS